MNGHVRTVLVVVVCAMLAASPIYAQARRRIKDLRQEELVGLANKSYMAYGSNTTTARLIFHGLQNRDLDPGMILSMADFFTETQREVAAVLYYYLYQRRASFDSDLDHRFMIMFSDAMYQYGLSKHRTKEGPLTLGDIYDYQNFDFDIDTLSKHADTVIPEFGSSENFIFVMHAALGVMCGFVEKIETKIVEDYFPENLRLTRDYEKWLESMPKEIDSLMRM